jgi:hypothetical protein
MSEETTTKYSSYTPAQKRASQLYRQKNKEKINEQRKKYYQKRKENDPSFLEYKRMKAKEYYEKNKLDKVVKPEAIPDVEMKDVNDLPEPLDVKEEIKVEEPVKITKTDIDIVDTVKLLEALKIDVIPIPDIPPVKMDGDDKFDPSLSLPKPVLKRSRASTKKKGKQE